MSNVVRLLQYATSRLVELENILLPFVPEIVWPAEVDMIFSQVKSAGELPAHHSTP